MIRFVTGNAGKVREAREYFDEPVEQVTYDYTEIQSDDLTEIATVGAREVVREIEGTEPIMLEDSGLFIDELNGFPGPVSAYVERTLGVERVGRIARRESAEPHRATFRSVVAIAWAEDDPVHPVVETFEGTVRGRIVEPRGSEGFGYDPIFEYNGRTFAEMTAEEKNAVSHRGRALALAAEWLAANTPSPNERRSVSGENSEG